MSVRAPRLDELTTRRATAEDAAGVGDVWLAAWHATFDFPPAYPDIECRRWLAEELLPSTEAWVVTQADGTVVAVLALTDDMIDQLYVAPAWIGRGLGRQLVELAMVRRPDGLDLFCFEANTRARAVYEHLGFVPVAFGDGSRNAERQPDIRYAWRPRSAP